MASRTRTAGSRLGIVAPPRAAEPELEEGVVAAGVYAGGRRVAEAAIEEAGAWSKRPGHVVWIGMHEPSDDLLRRVQRQFSLHELAIEDALQAHQHPKLEQYGEASFIVTRTAQMVDGHIALGETHLFVGRGYIVSVRHGASTPYTEVRKRCEACPTSLGNGEDYILYAILDFIVANYGPVLEKVRSEVEVIEDQVLAQELSHSQIERLYLLRRNLVKLRAAVTPLLDVCRRLEHSEVIAIDQEMKHRFRDVTDHVDRTRDDIDSLREVLAFAFEASLMMSQAQQNVITRQLASWAAILAVPTAIAGVYGMNFEDMPELKWQHGYFGVLAVIAVVCSSLYWFFRRKKWL